MSTARLATAARFGAVLLAAGGGASMAAAKPAHQHPSPAAQASQIEPAAVAALARMSAFLRSNRTFEVRMDMQRDEVDAYGQILTFSGASTYKVRAPNGLEIETSDAGQSRRYVYDGKSVTVFDPKSRYYGRFDAPPTIRETLDQAQTKYGIRIPLADLFRWGDDPNQANELTAAHFVDSETVGGQDAQHFAFREKGVDWQIWIADGDKPLPLRVVVVAADDPARPQFEADLTWDTAPQFAADTFVFTPPAQAKVIPMAAADQ